MRYHGKETEKAANGRYSRRLPQDIQRRAKMRLDRIRAATALDQLRSPPSHHLEALAGDRNGQHSIRINDQWRICFEWCDGHAHEVEIVDYHRGARTMTIDIPPIHPGEHLAEYLDEYGISQYRLAKSIHVPPRRINEIVHGKRRITADTALRLGRFFAVGAQFWLNLQTGYDLGVAQQEVGAEIASGIEPMERDAA